MNWFNMLPFTRRVGAVLKNAFRSFLFVLNLSGRKALLRSCFVFLVVLAPPFFTETNAGLVQGDSEQRIQTVIAAPVKTAVMPESIPLRRDQVSSGLFPEQSIFSFGLLLLFPIGMAAFIFFVAKRRKSRAPASMARWFGILGQGDNKADLRCVSSIQLSSKHSVHLIEWEGSHLLLGCSEGSLEVLGRGRVKNDNNINMEINNEKENCHDYA